MIKNVIKKCLYDIILDIHFRRFYPNDRTSLDHLESKSFSKNNSGEKTSYRTAEILDNTYPGWEKNKKFWVKNKNLGDRKKLY